jgi:putative transposase
VFLTINGKLHELWRAVVRQGNVLDILLQSRRNKRAAKKFFRKLLKGCQYVPRVLITDKLASYGAAKKEVLPSVEHRQHKRLNNRAENSTNQRVSVSERCGGSNREVTLNAFWPHTVPFGSTFALNATVLAQNGIVRCSKNASRFGTR